MRYKVVRVTDMPTDFKDNTFYVVGHKDNPHCLVSTCPKGLCKDPIHISIFNNEKWRLVNYADGTISLAKGVSTSSVKVNRKCRCHYHVRKSQIVWVTD